MTTIYILKLEHECYYVGKTNNYSKRINDHLIIVVHYGQNKNKVFILLIYKKLIFYKLTKLHKVICEEKIIPNCSSFDEDRYDK